MPEYDAGALSIQESLSGFLCGLLAVEAGRSIVPGTSQGAHDSQVCLGLLKPAPCFKTVGVHTM